MPNDPATITVLLVIFALVTVAEKLSSMVATWIRKPSFDKQMSKYVLKLEHERDAATMKADYLEKVAALKKENDSQWQRINGESITNAQCFRDIERSLGKIEGFIEQIEKTK
ncbi:MAG: hypothetical protein PF795_00645 [Kiritimatiellae bacterium]|jgi:hypothetical protein|nr:hypothetical protein [Kiritimatiellia bacterium]